MSKKGKEPAGLRRWRLAHRTKKTKRHTMARRKRRTGRRYGRKRKGHKKDKRFPLLVALPIMKPSLDFGYNLSHGVGLRSASEQWLEDATGFDVPTGKLNYAHATNQVILAIVGSVGSKAATKLGINRLMKKIPIVGSWVKL